MSRARRPKYKRQANVAPKTPSKKARWPQDAKKIHAKTSSKQFPFEFVTFPASKAKIYVQTRPTEHAGGPSQTCAPRVFHPRSASRGLAPPACSMHVLPLVDLRPPRVPSMFCLSWTCAPRVLHPRSASRGLGPPACSVRLALPHVFHDTWA